MYKETENHDPLKETKHVSTIHPLGNTEIGLNQQRVF